MLKPVIRPFVARCYSAAAVSAAPPAEAASTQTYEQAVAAYDKATEKYKKAADGSPAAASALEEAMALWHAKEALTPAIDHLSNWERANKIYFGPERDTKNFPHPERPEFHPPVRHSLIPEAWFEAFYKRTGVSGPYVLGGGVVTFALSKEILEFNDELAIVVLFFGVFIRWLGKKNDGQIGRYLDKATETYENEVWYEPKKQYQQALQTSISTLEAAVAQQPRHLMMCDANTEMVDLVMERRYRERLQDVYVAAKKKLDGELAKQNSIIKHQQRHMTNWIVDNVVKGITPQQEKDSIAKCIADLKVLSQKVAL